MEKKEEGSGDDGPYIWWLGEGSEAWNRESRITGTGKAEMAARVLG